MDVQEPKSHQICDSRRINYLPIDLRSTLHTSIIYSQQRHDFVSRYSSFFSSAHIAQYWCKNRNIFMISIRCSTVLSCHVKFKDCISNSTEGDICVDLGVIAQLNEKIIFSFHLCLHVHLNSAFSC